MWWSECHTHHCSWRFYVFPSTFLLSDQCIRWLMLPSSQLFFPPYVGSMWSLSSRWVLHENLDKGKLSELQYGNWRKYNKKWVHGQMSWKPRDHAVYGVVRFIFQRVSYPLILFLISTVNMLSLINYHQFYISNSPFPKLQIPLSHVFNPESWISSLFIPIIGMNCFTLTSLETILRKNVIWTG